MLIPGMIDDGKIFNLGRATGRVFLACGELLLKVAVIRIVAAMHSSLAFLTIASCGSVGH